MDNYTKKRLTAQNGLKNQRKMKAIKVEWIDSAGGSGWEFLEDHKEEPVHVTTYGFLVKEAEQYITIAQNYATETVQAREQIDNTISIPKCAITSIYELASSCLVPVLKRPLQGFSLAGKLSDHEEPEQQGEQPE